MDPITAIRRSLAAFVCGIVGMLPVIGLIPAICALGHGRAVRTQYKGDWNPAAIYLRAGVVLALCDIFNTILLVAGIALAIVAA